MKRTDTLPAIAILLGITFTAQLNAQTGVFTYQGLLTENSSRATGSYDLQINLYDAEAGGTFLGVDTHLATPVSNGLFSLELDFGSSVFNGDARWLEITAITNGGGAYVTLSPRQSITAAPYAIKAASAMAVNMGTISNPSFIGTTTSAPLDFFVNNLRGLRIEDNGDSASDSNTDSDGAPNIIGGSPANSVAAGVVGATISGGGALDWGGNGVRPNTVAGDYATIGGGYYNTIQAGAFGAQIGGGNFNYIGDDSYNASIGGGSGNSVFWTAPRSTIGGGEKNEIKLNTYAGTIAGGSNNVVGANADFGAIAGGRKNSIGENSGYAALGGGWLNSVGTSSLFASIGGGFGNAIQTNATAATIGGGNGNVVITGARRSTIGGGDFNVAEGLYSFIGGGSGNAVSILDGYFDSLFSGIGGGQGNTVAGNFNFTGGGKTNLIIGHSSMIGGGSYNEISYLPVYVEGPESAVIGGGWSNRVQASYGTIAGGYRNSIAKDSEFATVGGGIFNVASGQASVIGGGDGNRASGLTATVGGGQYNYATNDFATVGGGYNNVASGTYATVPGGAYNQATRSNSFAAGLGAEAIHKGTFVWADYQLFPFTSTGDNQFLIRATGGVGIGTAAPSAPLTVRGVDPTTTYSGQLALEGSLATGAANTGAGMRFIGNDGNIARDWAFIRGIKANSTVGNTLSALSFGTRTSAGAVAERMRLDSAGLTVNGTFVSSSDRNVKQAFAAVDPQTVLEKVAAMPMQEWSYISDEGASRHIGPMAQDFRAAFGLGADDKHIAMVDADGVALAAIQGLNEKLERENAELRQRLDRLEQLIGSAAQ